MKSPESAINPLDPAHWDRPLWIVCGYECYPQFLCAKLNHCGALNIWGYSIYKRKPGFRTIGRAFETWSKEQAMCFVFAEQQNALDFLKEITTPKVKS